jgi:transposase-like protein
LIHSSSSVRSRIAPITAGSPGRQLQCVSCHGYFSETHGTLLHGKCASAKLIVRVIACLAEGLGIRGTARVFEIDPNTVLGWLVEAAEQLHAFSAYFLHALHLNQVQLDELYAVLSAVREGDVSTAEAIERLSRSPHWVWTAIDPETKLLLSVQVGEHTLAMAQAILHQIAQLVAPGCVPLLLSDGYRNYLTAIVTHCGCWVHPPRWPAVGPAPKPRWMPLPELLLRPGGQDHETAADRGGQAPRRLRHKSGSGSSLGCLRLADQYGVCGAAQSAPASARGGDGVA